MDHSEHSCDLLALLNHIASTGHRFWCIFAKRPGVPAHSQPGAILLAKPRAVRFGEPSHLDLVVWSGRTIQ